MEVFGPSPIPSKGIDSFSDVPWQTRGARVEIGSPNSKGGFGWLLLISAAAELELLLLLNCWASCAREMSGGAFRFEAANFAEYSASVGGGGAHDDDETKVEVLGS